MNSDEVRAEFDSYSSDSDLSTIFRNMSGSKDPSVVYSNLEQDTSDSEMKDPNIKNMDCDDVEEEAKVQDIPINKKKKKETTLR